MSVVEELVADYKMPEVRRGKTVEYYPPGRENPIPVAAVVSAVWEGQIDVILVEGKRFRDSVHHKDDPRLEFHPEWRTSGTWDYTPEEKAAKAELTAIKARLSDLERTVKLLAPAKPAEKK